MGCLSLLQGIFPIQGLNSSLLPCRRILYLLSYQGIHLQIQETQETRVRSLVQEDPLEEGTATHSSILAWRIPSIEAHGGLQSTGLQRVRHD